MAGNKGPDLRSWVEAMAKDLVDHPETVEVRLVEEDDGDVFELSVEPDEMGRVIGRQGRTAQALRTLMRVAGARHGRDYELEILD
jgi:predicted RNA-binding protein YlqC (UPF0109 family)